MVRLKAIGFEAHAVDERPSWFIPSALIVGLETGSGPLEAVSEKRSRIWRAALKRRNGAPSSMAVINYFCSCFVSVVLVSSTLIFSRASLPGFPSTSAVFEGYRGNLCGLPVCRGGVGVFAGVIRVSVNAVIGHGAYECFVESEIGRRQSP
eukprot:IDg8118t1